MDISAAPNCDSSSGLQHLTLPSVTGTLAASSADCSDQSGGRPAASHHVTVSGPAPQPPVTGRQQLEGRPGGELPAELFYGGPDPSRIPGLVIEQVSVSVGSSGSGRPPPPPPSEEVIVVDVDLGVPPAEGSDAPPLPVPESAEPVSVAEQPAEELSELRADRRSREPALPPMDTLRPTGEVTLTPVTLPGVCRAVSAASATVSAEPHYDIMSSCLRNGPLVQLNTADLELLPLPAAHHSLDVAGFCGDSSDSIGVLTDKLVSPPKLELLGAVPMQLPSVEPSLNGAAGSPVVSASTTRLPPPYPQKGGQTGAARLSALCQQLTERVEAHKCALCSFVSLKRQDVSTHLLANHRAELERRKSGARRAGRSPPPPPPRVISATSQAHCVVNAHGRVRIRARPPPPETPVVPSPAPPTPDTNSANVNDNTPGDTASSAEPPASFESAAGMTDSDDVEVMWMGGSAVDSADTEQHSAQAEVDPLAPDVDPLGPEKETDVGTEAQAQTQAEAEAQAAEEEAESEDDPIAVKSRRLLKKVSALEPSVLRGVLAGKKKGRPSNSRTLGVSTLSGSRGSQRQIEKELGFLPCKEPECGLRLRDREKLEIHERCHLAENPAHFGCIECSHTTRKWRAMSLHMWREHKIDCDLYYCDLCDYKTARYSNLVNVHRPTHGQSRNFRCLTCGKAFKSAKQLQNHRAKHRLKTDPAYLESCRCDICNAVLSDRRALVLHKEMVHEKRKQFQCKSCGNVFSCRSSLVMHERQHSGQKPFVCEHCPYSSTDHNTLRRHKMRHTGERPYKCPHCDYSCIQSSTYKKHLRMKHPGAAAELVFSCHVCMFKTIQRSCYVRHMQEHPDAGPPPENPPPPSSEKPPQDPQNPSEPPPPPTLSVLPPPGELQQHVVRVHEPRTPPLPVVAEVTGAAGAVSASPLLPPGPLRGGGLATTATVYQLVPQGDGRPPLLTPTQVQLIAPPAPVGKPARAPRGSRSARKTMR